MKSNSEARLSTVFLYSFTSVFTISQPLGSGYHEIKVNELLRLSMKRWDKGSELRIRKGYLCECFFFLPSLYIPHLSMHLERSRGLNVLWTIWNFSMISDEKVPGLYDFCHHRGVDFASWAPRAKAMTWVASNEECFSSEIWEIAVFLYNWLVSPWELPDKTSAWKFEQKTTVARPWS